ncbi:hypothetical protein V2J09_021223, partial [Rumex salicifolius]
KPKIAFLPPESRPQAPPLGSSSFLFDRHSPARIQAATTVLRRTILRAAPPSTLHGAGCTATPAHHASSAPTVPPNATGTLSDPQVRTWLWFFKQVTTLPTSDMRQGARGKQTSCDFIDTILSSMSTFPNREALNVFLKTKCKLGKITICEANQALDYMLQLNPQPPNSSFNLLLGSIVKIKHYTDAICCYKRMCSNGLVPDFITLNIVQNSCCYLNSGLGFSVFGLILKKGFRPNVVTFTSLVKGLCMEGRIVGAIRLFRRMEESGCRPNMTAYGTLIKGLCGTRNLDVATKCGPMHKYFQLHDRRAM